MGRLITVCIVCLMCLGSLAAQPRTIDKVVGIVGDKPILYSDIEIQYQQYAQEGEVPADMRCQLMDQLLSQKLLLAQAEIDSVTTTEEEVDAELEKRIRHFISMVGSQERLEEFYQKSVAEIKEEFRPDVRDQLVAQKMQGQITKDVRVTPSEVKAFFNEIHPDSLPYYDAEVQVGHIVIYAQPSDAQKREALRKIREMREEIVAGSDFKLKAILYSQDPGSASKGGELPEFTRNDPFAPEFIAVSFRLQEGEISQPFETEFGYHIVQLMERKGDRVKVRHILIPPELSNDNMRLAQRKADSIRTLLERNEITFGFAVSKFSEDEATNKYGGFLMNSMTGESFFAIDELGAMDRSIPFVLDTMQAGQYSAPVMYADQRGKRGYRILYLKHATEPHRASLEQDYGRIQAAALNQKKQAATRRWLETRISRTYIWIDPTFTGCEALKPWMAIGP